MGIPSSELVTVPVILTVCACAMVMPTSSKPARKTHSFFIEQVLGLQIEVSKIFYPANLGN